MHDDIENRSIAKKVPPCCSLYLLGDLREKFFKKAWWPKCFFVKPSKARTVTIEQLVAMFSPLNLL